MDVRIPLFPLNTVLFPGQVLPLHIFEPRYRQMIGECLQRSAPFGVVLIKRGTEAGAPATPVQVGTTARIAEIQTLDDGRMNIITVGETRFRVDVVHAEQPYLEATATLWRWPDEASRDLGPLAGNVLALLQQYLQDAGQGASPVALADLSNNPVLIATAAAAVPELPLHERQHLLELPTLRDLLQREANLLEQERQVLRALRMRYSAPADPETPFNPN